MLRKKITGLLNRFAHWRLRHIGDDTFLILAAALTGIITSICAVLLKMSVHYIQEVVQKGIFVNQVEWMYLFYPLIGILLCTFYVQIFLHSELGRGTGLVLVAISRKYANVERHKMYSQMVSSILTVGFGGSAGLEAPIVVTGSAYGSRIGNALRMTLREKTLLIACGAAAGISAIFNCPIAGVIFAMEVILIRTTVPAFIPILIAAATSSLVSKILYSGQPFFRITDDWNVSSTPYYIAFGLLCGLLSVYNIRVYSKCEEWFAKIKKPFAASIICGILLGILVFVFPPLYGEGYSNILGILHGDFQQLFLQSPMNGMMNQHFELLVFGSALALTKVFATSLTIGGGGNGGMFGSSLYAGAFLGLIFTEIIKLSGLAELNSIHFIVIGMAGLLSGVIHAPLTAIFLIAEITGGYTLFIPLMIVSALSYFITKYFEPYSVYTRKLAKRGLLVFNNPDQDVLNHIRLKNLVENDFASVSLNGKLAELIEKIGTSKRNLFPVLDELGQLHGVIVLDDIRSMMFDQSKYGTVKISDIMTRPPATLDIDEDMPSVMQKFETTQAWNLPVIKENKYIGFVSKSNIFTRYRSQLIEDLSKE